MSATDPTGTVPGPTGLLKRSASPDDARYGDSAERRLAWAREMERAQLDSWFKPMLTTGNAAAERESARSTRMPQPGGARASAAAPRGLSAREIPLRDLADREHQLRDPGQREPLARPSEAARGPRAAARTLSSFDRSSEAQAQSTGATPFSSPQAGSAGNDVFDAPTSVAATARDVQAPTSLSGRAFAALDAVMALPGTDEGPESTAEPARSAPGRTQATAQARGVEAGATSTSRTLAPVRLHEESTPKGQAVWIAMRADDATLAAMLPQWVADLQRGMRTRGERLHQVVCNGQIVWRDGVSTPLRVAVGNDAIARPFMFDSIDSKEA
ncbi:hypothetical protein [Variovorax boronicumulans]|uniref:hypothetical protein n=1 Tax=Variovorax boronicumulans TaxID=436515 RepID=UPI00277D4F90|nr:hypothetical protein [Variovorax boronicumulans]MDQ0045436.1 hypothetical protein [Variovorax boronicumulans]